RTPEFRIEVTRQNLNLTNGALTEVKWHKEFCLGKIRPCLEGIGAIDESVRIKVIHTGEISSSFRVPIAGLGRTRNEYSQIQKLSASTRQVLDKSAIQRCARLFSIRIDGGRAGDLSDGFARSLLQGQIYI